MDFHNMRRKQLQALCKKHGISANKTNLEMASLLASTLKVRESENSVRETKDEEQEEVEEADVVNGDAKEKKNKKVRFSPDVETREYEPSVYKVRGGRVYRKRKEVDSKQNKVVVKSGIVSGNDEFKVVGNKRGLEKRKEEVVAKKRRVSKGGIRGRNVVASEEKSEFEGTRDELGKEGLVGRNVSRRNSSKNDEKKCVVGSIMESEQKVSLEIETLQGMKRKQLQSLCKKHGIPANKTSLEMVRLLAATLKVSQENGSLQRSGSAIHMSERTERSNEKEPSGDNEGSCVQLLEPHECNVEELIEEETVTLKEETMLATEAAHPETISLVKQPMQEMKSTTPQVSKKVKKPQVSKKVKKPQVSKKEKKTKEYKSISKRDLGDGLDGLSDTEENSDNAQSVEEIQNSTPVVDELPTSQTEIITCSSANQPGLEKEVEVEELSRGKDSQRENREFNDHSADNDCSIQVESDVNLSLDDIQEQVDHEASANWEVGHDESDPSGRTLVAEEISITVQETKDNERDIGLILPSNNNDQEQVELSDVVNHNDCETISKLDIPEDISKELMGQKEKKVLESDCSADSAQVMDVISSEDVDVDGHVEELTVQDVDLGCPIEAEIVGGNSYKEVSPLTHSKDEPSFDHTSCDGFEVSRMEIVHSAVSPDAEFPTKTLNSENVKVQDADDSGSKEVGYDLNENSDERVSQNTHDESRFSEQWSAEQLEEKETESEFGNSQVSHFTQSTHANLVEGESAEKHEHCEDISEINGEAIDNGTHTESPKTLRTQQAPDRRSSSPCMLGLLFPDEREELTETQSAAPENLLFPDEREEFTELTDSKDPIGTSETVIDSLEINPDKSDHLDNSKNSIEMNEGMFVDSENVLSGNIKPEYATETVENMDEVAEEMSTPLALTSNKKQAKQSFTEEIPVCSKSYRKSEKKSLDTSSELKDLPFRDAAELKNETSDVAASAFVGGNEKNNGEEPTTEILLFPAEREEFTDSKDSIWTSETVIYSSEINPDKPGHLDDFKNSIEVNEDMLVDSENAISRNIKPEDAMEMETFENKNELADELTTPLALTSNKKQAKLNFTEEIPVYSKSCGKPEKKSIEDLPFHYAAELKNETSDVASAFVEGNEKYNGEEPTTDALQESWSNDYVVAMPIKENVSDLERFETTVVEKQLGNASPIDRNEFTPAGDEISNQLHNVSASKQELTEQVRDNIKNVEIEHSYAIEGMPMKASVTVDDKLNSSPEVDSIDTKGAIDASNEKHDSANGLSEIDDAVNEGFFWSDINISTQSKLTSEDKNECCVMGTNEAPLQKPNVDDSAASRNKETMNVEGFHVISSSKLEILEDSFGGSKVNASHYDTEQEVETTDTEAQQLSLMNKDVMEIHENSKINTQTAGELEDQHGENVYSAEEKVAEQNMNNSHDVSELLHFEENEHSSMQDNLLLEVDQIQGSCSPDILEESVKGDTNKDNFGRLGLNEQFLSEDVQPDSADLDQSISCINAAVSQEITSELEDQHGQNVHLEENGVVEAKTCSDHDFSESPHIDEITGYDLPLKGVQIQGSCSPETDKDENLKAENYPVNSENNENGGLVGQGTGDENNAESEQKLPSVEPTSLIVMQEQRIATAKQLITPALKSKNRRTVLIHGTPKRVLESSEMKENIHSSKTQQAGNLTAQRALPKRRPLEDVR